MHVGLTNPDQTMGWEEPSVPLQSLGGYVSSTQAGPDLLADVFEQQVDYRCVCIDAEGAVSITVTLSGPGLELALDPTESQTWDSSFPQALVASSPTSPPTGGTLTWVTGQLAIPDPDPDTRAFWIRRTPTGSGGAKSGQLTVDWYEADGPHTWTVPLAWTEPAPPPPQLPPATAPAVRDLWIGPLGWMRPVEERSTTWTRPRDLATAEFRALDGRVTASRGRRTPRRTAWAWDRLRPVDYDHLVEVTYTSRTGSAVVEVIDPAARNLLSADQSRGRPLATGTTAEAVADWTISGGGDLMVGLTGADRWACVRDPADGAVLTWLGPYYGPRGWPVMPGMGVHWRLATTGTSAIAATAQPRLMFYDSNGGEVGYAVGGAGSAYVSADAPDGAVTVVPQAVLAARSGLTIIGAAHLAYAPIPTEGDVPIGDGCPTYTIANMADSPQLPYHSVTLDLVEVRSGAYR
ncbi:hypothetical protein GCM10027294_25720 [Marinactinospora endophytica]